GNVITLKPREDTTWLNHVLSFLDEMKLDRRILAHLTLKGNFIWGGKEKEIRYLDGEAFGVPGKTQYGLRVNDDKTINRDGRRGGDFEMWFWLVGTQLQMVGVTVGVIAPKITSINPSTGVRGSSANATISGVDLAQFLQGAGARIEFQPPGILATE